MLDAIVAAYGIGPTQEGSAAMSRAGGLSTLGDDRPRLALGVRLHRDRHERRWMLLYPEGFLRTSATGTTLLRLCNGPPEYRRDHGRPRPDLPKNGQKRAPDVIDFVEQLHARNLVSGAIGVASREGPGPISTLPVESAPHDRSTPGELRAPEHAAQPCRARSA